MPECALFAIRDSDSEIRVVLEPIDTFDARVRVAVGAVWVRVTSIAVTLDGVFMLARAGLIQDDRSPSQYVGKYLNITDVE